MSEENPSADSTSIRGLPQTLFWGNIIDGGETIRGGVLIKGPRIIARFRGELEHAKFPDDVHIEEVHTIAPGLIDLQINGSYGIDVATEGARIPELANALPRHGVTAFLPTVISSLESRYRTLYRTFPHDFPNEGAAFLGWHFEGPFLNPNKCGAHPKAAIIDGIKSDPYGEFSLSEWILQRFPNIKLITLAPEMAGNIERIQQFREAGALISMGHCDPDEGSFIQGIQAGASLVTHLFNAMSPLHHRKPGPAGWALAHPDLDVTVIADGLHVHPTMIDLAWRLKGPNRFILVSDAMAGAGMPPGEYRLAEEPFIEVDERSAKTADGTLAGSILTLDQAVRNLAEFSSATFAQAWAAASENPARALGLKKKGQIKIGHDADLAILDEDKRVVQTYCRGIPQLSTSETSAAS